MEQNVRVCVEVDVGAPLVFELARNSHMKDDGARVFTVTACFQNPPAHLLAQAWRILLEVCRGKELLPEHARAYARRAVARAGQRVPDDLGSALQQGPGAGEGPGSASSRRRLRPGQSLRNCWRGLLGTTCRKEMVPGPSSKQLELPGVLTMEENVGPGSARSRCEVAWASEDITLCGVCASRKKRWRDIRSKLDLTTEQLRTWRNSKHPKLAIV